MLENQPFIHVPSIKLSHGCLGLMLYSISEASAHLQALKLSTDKAETILIPFKVTVHQLKTKLLKV